MYDIQYIIILILTIISTFTLVIKIWKSSVSTIIIII